MNAVIHKARVCLINIGKALPFVICFVVFISYAESLFSLATSDYIVWDGYVVPNKPISWLVGRYLEYNIQMLSVLVIISIAVETCIYNKLACAYLGINLFEKAYFDFEFEPIHICVICIINIIIAGYVTYRGLKILNNTLWK